MTNNIHPTAIIHEKAKVGNGVEIGPYCIIGEHVELADNVKLRAHVNVDCHAYIGEGTEIFPFASISIPQDLKYAGEPSKVIIGKNCKIREHVTIQSGTADDRMQTVVGDNCLLMVGVHIAHDCIVGNNVIMANNATLAGHVDVGDFCIIGGLAAVKQFIKIGSHSIVSGTTGLADDVIPYGNVIGNNRGMLEGLNVIGLKRRQFDRKTIHELRNAYKTIFLEDYATMQERIEDVETEYPDNESVMEVVNFLKNNEQNRSVCVARKESSKAA